MYKAYQQHFGPNGDPRILVAQGASRDFNPSLPQKVVDRAFDRDPVVANAEYGGQFRADLELFVAREIVEAAVDPRVYERAPMSGVSYVGFADPAGGSGADSMTAAVAHSENGLLVLDAVRERPPPFSPKAVVEEFANLFERYHISRIEGDHFAGQWAQEAFASCGIWYRVAKRTKTDIYRDLLAELNSRSVRLIDHSRLINQICGLERRTLGGRDVIDHARGAHDDLVNAAFGELRLAKPSSHPPSVGGLNVISVKLHDPFTAPHLGDYD